METLSKIHVPETYNYIGVFLTFACNLRCSYCLNKFREVNPVYKNMEGKDWVKGLNRIVTRPDLPISLQGGEPTVHPDFYEIVNGVDRAINLDLLTNLQFDFNKFISRVDKDRFKRDAKYASIRVSYHIETMALLVTLDKVRALQDKGYSVGVWCVQYPGEETNIKHAQEKSNEYGIDFRVKEYLGFYNGTMCGTYKYPLAVDGVRKKCECKPSELLLAPNGGIYRCHYDLYSGKNPYANLLDETVVPLVDFKECDNMGLCNPCDIKTKFNRFQENGWCSVEIKGVNNG